MSILDRISQPTSKPVVATILGEPGVGKTSLAAAFPKPVFVKIEDGTEGIPESLKGNIAELPEIKSVDQLWNDLNELVKEEQERFDLLRMLANLNQYLGEDARAKGIDYLTDMPSEPIIITGLEARLAQVFVNLITNAISFCEAGGAIRIWACRRADRVLVVVEDTGPGIPAGTFDKIFERFYSHRPDRDFGNHSGLGLAISKQIIEAHDGVIWAENIQPTETGATSTPIGARFVVGLSCSR